MKTIQRTTEVISISLPKKTAIKLEQARKVSGQSRSAFIGSLINKIAEEEKWQRIYGKDAWLNSGGKFANAAGLRPKSAIIT